MRTDFLHATGDDVLILLAGSGGGVSTGYNICQ